MAYVDVRDNHPPARTDGRAKLVSWTLATGDSGSLHGYAAISLPPPLDFIIIDFIPIFVNEEGEWGVGQPKRVRIGTGGGIKTRYGGGRDYDSIIRFPNHAGHAAWRVMVLQALRDAGTGPGP
jgi:hypothetical protein